MMKFYSPLTADFCMDEFAWEDEPVVLAGEDLLDYAESISDALQSENAALADGDLMPYYHATDGVSEKVVRAVVSVEAHKGKLCGCATIQLREPLTADECAALTEYLCGQYSDGFGEGFEQREIRVDGGALFVHLWQPNGFSFEQECIPQHKENPQKGADPMNRPMKKYEITDMAHPRNPALHRIRALVDLNEEVKAGAIGGYVETESNLSQDGSCWIYDDAVACEEACVAQDAALRGNAMARGAAFVGGHAGAAGSAVVQDYAILLAGSVFENACICGDGKIVEGPCRDLEPRIFGSARIYGTISGNVVCCSDTVIPPGMELINPTKDQFTLNGKGIRIQPCQESRAVRHKHKCHEQER